MSRTWSNGGPPFLNADNLNALEADVTTALGVPDAALAARVVAGATAAALNATYGRGFIITDPQFGVTRGTTSSQTAAIKAALDAHPGATFYFPPGDYRLDTSLQITKGNALVLDRSARLYAGAAMSILVDYTTLDSSFVLDKGIVGGVFDGNLLASTCVSIQNVLRFTLTQFTIHDGIHRGIKVGPEGAEVIGYDGRLYNTGITNVSDNIAIEDTMGDNYWSNIIILDWTQGVKDAAASTWTNIHPWLSNDVGAVTQMTSRYPTSIAFEFTSQSDLNLCYSDTYRTAFKPSTNGTGYTPPARLLNCRAYWAPTNLPDALATANPAHVIDNTDGIGATVDTMMTGGLPDVPAIFLNGSATNLTVRGTVNQGFTTGVADYIAGVKQGDTTFTPTLYGSGGAGTHTYTAQVGHIFVGPYTTTYSVEIQATTDSTTAFAGALCIGGLPLPSGATHVDSGSGYVGLAVNAPLNGALIYANTAPFISLMTSQGSAGLQETDIAANSLRNKAVHIILNVTVRHF